MSNPFTQPTLQGYNSSAPSDDGSATSANTVKWATHVDKLGDPLKTYAQAISANASTAFGKIFGADYQEKTAAYSIADSDQGTILVLTGSTARTFTLPAIASVGTNFVIGILNRSSAVLTVDGNASETIDGATTLTLPLDGSFAIIVSNGTSWRALALNTDVDTQFKQLSADSSKASTTTLADESDLSGFTLVAGVTYHVEGYLAYTQNGGDLKFTFDLDSAATGKHAGRHLATDESGTVAAGDCALSSTGASDATTITTMTDTDEAGVKIDLTFTAENDATTLDFQWAQSTSDSDNTTIRKGSFVRLTRVSN